jgi:hypothetical protein
LHPIAGGWGSSNGRNSGKRENFAVSNLQAKLSAGDVFTFEKYKISVETINTEKGVAGVTVLSNGRNVCAGDSIRLFGKD